MCDCYWPKCERCDTTVPLHIADFCMPRSDVSVYCADHLPPRNVVVYESVSEAFCPAFGHGDHFYHEPPKGWRMGVRHRRRPPRDYGLRAVEPNSASDYLAEHRTRGGGRTYFTKRCSNLSRSERGAIRAALRGVGRRRAQFVKDRPALAQMLDSEQRVWEGMEAGRELHARAAQIAYTLPLVRQLRDSGNLVALVLIGSLANRDFVPGLSDVDLWVLGRRLKPALVTENFTRYGHEFEVQLVCRNLSFLNQSLREGTPVDLIALRYGEVLYDDGFLHGLRRKAGRFTVTPNTRDLWMRSSARWLSTAVAQLLSPTCAHCFFGALYHAARDLLRAHLLAHGADLVEGWEVEAAVQERLPDLAEAYGKIRWARANWESYAFPILEDRTRIEGELGELVLELEAIARVVYRGYDLRLPRLQTLLRSFVSRQGAERFFSFDIRPDEAGIWVGYEGRHGKLKFGRRRIPHVGG